MFGRRLLLPKPRPGYPVRQANAPLALLERLGRHRGGRGTLCTPAGAFDYQPGILIRIGYTGSDGIAAANGGDDGLVGSDVTDASLIVNDRNPYAATIQTWESTYIGFNLSSQPVAGNTLIISEWLWGVWVTIWEDCPSSD
jgi:hypothetical protein